MSPLYKIANRYGGRKLKSTTLTYVRLLTAGPLPQNDSDYGLPEDATPQGIQGSADENCSTFGVWLDNCRRYGLTNCDQQLQGIQTGRKTLAEVLAEQEVLIAEIAERYRDKARMQDFQGVQGVQENVSMLPDVNMPCPQGVQGEDCERFKLWLENCHRFGFTDCMQQLKGFHRGRTTLAQIFEEQDQAIREAVTVMYQQKRKYSTAPRPQPTPETVETAQAESEAEKAEEGSPKPKVEEGVVLSARQKLQRAIKEYGSTVMVFHISISLMSLGFFYTLVNSGIDVVAILERVGLGGESMQAKVASGTGTFVVAYAVHKVFAPARIAITLTATPLIVRHLRRIGFLKAPKVSVPKS